jgi:hypothetical protein
MVKNVIRPLPPTAKLDWQRVGQGLELRRRAADKTPADLAMGAVEAIKRHPALDRGAAIVTANSGPAGYLPLPKTIVKYADAPWEPPTHQKRFRYRPWTSQRL